MAKQAELTGMEGNRKLQDLHDAAEDYVEIRDKRMKLTPEEVEAKAKVLALMHRHNKQNYKFNGLEITVIPGEEKVKVRIKSEDGEEEKESE